MLFELITVIERRGQYINHRKITIGFDNRKNYRNIINELNKSNIYAIEVGAEISEIKNKIKEIKFEVQIVWNRGHEENIGAFWQNFTKYLLKECDLRARQVRDCIKVSNHITNVKFYSNYGLKRGKGVKLRAINETIQIIDAKDSKNEYVKKNMDININLLIKRYEMLLR